MNLDNSKAKAIKSFKDEWNAAKVVAAKYLPRGVEIGFSDFADLEAYKALRMNAPDGLPFTIDDSVAYACFLAGQYQAETLATLAKYHKRG